MRFAVRLAYNGGSYSGWQSQNNAITVQQEIEDAIALRYQKKIPIFGCCRTDKGVHAKDFILHFDFDEDISENFTYSLNKILPKEIVLYSIIKTHDSFHSRFDAISRSYEYKIHTVKNPFNNGLSFLFPMIKKADFDLVQKASALLLDYGEFFPFCKTNSDVKTVKCSLQESKWIYNQLTGEYLFKITSDRFLRGMVRMIVGMSLNVGLGKISIEELIKVMQNQTRMKLDWSVPANGLYLSEVKYLTLD